LKALLFNAFAIFCIAICIQGERIPLTELSSLASEGLLESTPTIDTANGKLVGFVDGDVFAYLGIPFASPPTGDLRFRSPQPPQNWSGTYSATSFGNICVQYPEVLGIHLGAEDCLYVNVYTPADAIQRAAAGDPYPVMFWIYGGALVLGDGYEFGLYDARNLVSKRDVIVVTFNYRLGVFGFMAHPSLAAEDPDNSTGNYGVQDQRAALQWVKTNIAAFGGNPSAVTIFGESAGAFSVCYHLASAASGGLFQAAIMESGSCDSSDFFQPYSVATSFGDIYAASCGCDTRKLPPSDFLACLRKLSVSDLLKDISSWFNPNWPYSGDSTDQQIAAPELESAVFHRSFHRAQHVQRSRSGRGADPHDPMLAPVFPWGIAIDGTNKGLKDRPVDLLPTTVNDVPLIIGTNMNEGSMFLLLLPFVVPGASFPISDEALNLTLTKFFNSSVAEDVMDNVYPIQKFKNNDARSATILRDYIFICPTRRAARALYSNKATPTYMYQFSYKEDWIENLFLGDYHASELMFVFDNQWPPILHTFSANDTIVADFINTYWTNMAKYHTPNAPSAKSAELSTVIDWPEYDTQNEENLEINIPLAYKFDLVEERCDYWDTVTDRIPSDSFSGDSRSV
jgi:para-nitrobenzyl esterase